MIQFPSTRIQPDPQSLHRVLTSINQLAWKAAAELIARDEDREKAIKTLEKEIGL